MAGVFQCWVWFSLGFSDEMGFECLRLDWIGWDAMKVWKTGWCHGMCTGFWGVASSLVLGVVYFISLGQGAWLGRHYSTERKHLRTWLLHLAVVSGLVGVCGWVLGLQRYLLLFEEWWVLGTSGGSLHTIAKKNMKNSRDKTQGCLVSSNYTVDSRGNKRGKVNTRVRVRTVSLESKCGPCF